MTLRVPGIVFPVTGVIFAHEISAPSVPGLTTSALMPPNDDKFQFPPEPAAAHWDSLDRRC